VGKLGFARMGVNLYSPTYQPLFDTGKLFAIRAKSLQSRFSGWHKEFVKTATCFGQGSEIFSARQLLHSITVQ
jgi:hypothetical protein